VVTLSSWNQPPNLAPCASWESCGRNYEVVEFDTSGGSRSVLGVTPVVSIDRDGVRWALDPTGDIPEQRANVNVQQRRFLLFLGFATCALLVLLTLPAGPFALP